MFGTRIRLVRILGFTVWIDPSFVVIAALVTWTLAANLFPATVPGLPMTAYWVMGFVGFLGLFASIVVHELAHSLVARHYGIPMKGITLFIFGGVAEMDEEPPDAKSEFLMAAVGPLTSFALAGGFFGLSLAGKVVSWPPAVLAVGSYLAGMNCILAIFNLIPGFPLDGGRMLRAALWWRKGNLRKATRISSRVGSGFGMALMLLGAWYVVTGNFVAGMWNFLIGMFLRGAASMSYRQLVTRQALEGEPISRFMIADPVTVPRHIPVQELVHDYFLRHHFKMFPVMDGDRLLGCITLQQVKHLPREEWPRRTVGEVAARCGPENTIAPDTDAVRALSKMSRTGATRLMVVEGDRLVGIISLRDLLAFLSLKVELDEA